jgi:tRNA U34 5-methylaminomethyl-2-thiouridine-forming methyltransferase MnmC
MKPEKFLVVPTSDGSVTIHDLQFGESFHSSHGAVSESLHVFIKNGYDLMSSNEIDILEIGFGTGLNCLLTIINKKQGQKIRYHAIEKFPLSSDENNALNYSQVLNIEKNLFGKIIQQEWEIETEIESGFILKKNKVDLLEYMPPQMFDLIYFDAFSPNVQPELWTVEVFKKLYDSLHKNGILTTYSSKGDVKRALRSAGFFVKRIVGPIGKRHILRATK